MNSNKLIKLFTLLPQFSKKIIVNNVVNIAKQKGYILYKKDKIITTYHIDAGRKNIINLIKKIKAEKHLLQDDLEAYQIFTVVESVKKIKGDLVEVGVYKGRSAKIIFNADKKKILHLFDTFKGIPAVDNNDDSYIKKGELTSSFRSLKNYFSKNKNVFIYKGICPASAKPIKNKKFSFVHLDVDTYKSTLNCLNFFYPRMNKGGAIMSHNYIDGPGVKKAINEFFKSKKEPVIEMPGNFRFGHCLIIKL